MNKSEILAMKCKQISKGNVKCFSILMELEDAGREDIINEIINVMNYNYNALSPEKIVAAYNACGGKEKFIAKCNKIWNKKSYKIAKREYEYEEELKQYACGERIDHPDGTRFEDGKEITYD